MKSVYLFNEVSRAAIYGIGTYINQMAATLATQNDISLTVVTLNHTDKEFTEKIGDRVRYINIPNHKINYHLDNKKNLKRFYQGVAFLLSPYIEADQENIFHFNYNHCEPLICLLKEKYPTCKAVLTIHYLGWCFNLKSNTSYFRKIIAATENDLKDENEKYVFKNYTEEKSLFKLVDKIICLTNYTYGLLQQDYGISSQKLALIYNGLQDEAKLLTKAEKTILKKKYYLPQHAKTVLFVGRLDEIKGVNFLIEAFCDIVKNIPSVYLLVVGDGNYNSNLKQAESIWTRVIFTGKLEKDRLYELYQLADVGVMLSFHEQCSYVAIEMMMHGIPLVITDSSGLNDVVIPEKNGYKIHLEEKDKTIDLPIEKCKEALIKALQGRKDVLKKNCRQLFESRYHLNIMHRKVLELYKIL